MSNDFDRKVQPVIWPVAQKAPLDQQWRDYTALLSRPQCAKLRKENQAALESIEFYRHGETSAFVEQVHLYPEDYPWLYERLGDAMAEFAHSRGISVAGFTEPLLLHRYAPGHHIGWHADYIGTDISKVSIAVELGPRSYTGGELDLLNTATPVLQEGDAIVFPSHVAHRVRQVMSGERWSLTGWVAGAPFT